MSLSAQFTYPGYRGIEANDTDQRVTEDNVLRAIQSPNAGLATIAADGTLVAFAGAISVKNSGSFQTPATSVKYGGAWVTPTRAYTKHNSIWKRIL